MSLKTIEVKVSEEVYAEVKRMAEAGRGKGRGARVPCTIGEMAADLVGTGAYRRIAANKWAKANAKPAAPKKPKAPKPPKAPKKPAAPKAAKKAAVPKAKKAPAKAAKKPKPAPASAAATPEVDPLG